MALTCEYYLNTTQAVWQVEFDSTPTLYQNVLRLQNANPLTVGPLLPEADLWALHGAHIHDATVRTLWGAFFSSCGVPLQA